MKRILLYTFLSLGTLPILTGCYEDQSTEASITIPEIEIDTVGLNQYYNSDYKRYAIDVQQFSKLTLSIPASQEGVDNPDLTYEWKITMAPESSNNADVDFMTISEEKDLEYEITQAPNTRPYLLWYRVTDKKNGIMKGMVWCIKIVSKYNEGLLVAQDTGTGDTDLSFLSSEQFTIGHTGEPSIVHNVYSNANEGAPIEGLVKQIMFYQRNVSGQGVMNHLVLIGDKFYQHIDNGFKNYGRDAEVSYDAKQKFDPTQVGKCASAVILVNEGKVYAVTEAKLPYLSMNIPNSYTHPITGKDAECIVDKYVAMRHWSKNNATWGLWYDKNNGIFLYQDYNYGPAVKNGMKTLPVANNAIFDPNNSPNLDTKYASIGYNLEFYFIMQNKETKNYQVMVFDGSKIPAVPAALYHIPTSENAKLDQAISYYVSEEGKVIYFATKHDVYTIQLDATVPTVNKIYSSNDEITYFSMFHQGFFEIQSQPEYYQHKVLNTHHNMLLVGTWNGSKGTLRTLPILNPTTGFIDASKESKYEGFGKILTVVHQQ